MIWRWMGWACKFEPSPFAKSWVLIFKIPERERKRVEEEEEDTCDSVVVAIEATVKASSSSAVGKSNERESER